jgi:hypothetical protein
MQNQISSSSDTQTRALEMKMQVLMDELMQLNEDLSRVVELAVDARLTIARATDETTKTGESE